MEEIAGSEDQFFKVSKYASLGNIASPLEKSITGLEGKPQYL